jgi:hypothetical protein
VWGLLDVEEKKRMGEVIEIRTSAPNQSHFSPQFNLGILKILSGISVTGTSKSFFVVVKETPGCQIQEIKRAIGKAGPIGK